MGTYTFGFGSETPISVPSVSIDIYKNAAFWSEHASKIVGH